ncbi:hypothetical protein JXO52_00800 [bacterium]|nr:hypothetical protein [bacterium]
MKGDNRAGIIAGSGVLLALAALITQCTFESPATPNWDVLFELPLVAKRFVMSDLVDDIDELSVQGQQLVLSLEENIETFEVGDRLRVDDFVRNVTVPANGSLSDSLQIPNDLVVVDTAVIRQGMLRLTFTNRGNTAVDAHLELADMKDTQGAMFAVDAAVPAGNGASVEVYTNLAGYMIVPPVWNGSNFMRFSVSLSGGTDVDVEVRFSDLAFASISGIINNMEVPLEDMEADLDFPEEFNDLEIDTVDLRLAVDAGVAFPIIVDLLVQGLDTDDGVPRTITVLDTITPVSGEMSVIVIEGVADFFNAHPERMLISGRMLIGDGLVSSRIDENHVIDAVVYLDMPLTIRLPGYASTTDPDTLELDEDTRDVFRDNIVSAHLTADILNGLPLGVTVRIVFSATRSDSTIYDPGGADLSITAGFGAAPTDGGSPAVVTGTAPGSIDIDLGDAELDLFRNNEMLFWGVEIDFPGTALMVRIRPQDFIEVEARLTAMLNTKIPEEDEGEGGAS